MDDALAHNRLVGVLELIDRWGDLYNRRWGNRAPYQEQPGLAPQVEAGIDEVRARTKLAHDVIQVMGEERLAAKVVEKDWSAGHPFTEARVAIRRGGCYPGSTGGTGRPEQRLWEPMCRS